MGAALPSPAAPGCLSQPVLWIVGTDALPSPADPWRPGQSAAWEGVGAPGTPPGSLAVESRAEERQACSLSAPCARSCWAAANWRNALGCWRPGLDAGGLGRGGCSGRCKPGPWSCMRGACPHTSTPGGPGGDPISCSPPIQSSQLACPPSAPALPVSRTRPGPVPEPCWSGGMPAARCPGGQGSCCEGACCPLTLPESCWWEVEAGPRSQGSKWLEGACNMLSLPAGAQGSARELGTSSAAGSALRARRVRLRTAVRRGHESLPCPYYKEALRCKHVHQQHQQCMLIDRLHDHDMQSSCLSMPCQLILCVQPCTAWQLRTETLPSSLA